MSRRLLLGLVALVIGASLLAEALLSPSSDERWQLLLIIAAPALFAAAVTPLVGRWVSRRSSVAGVGLTVGLCALAMGAASSSAASNAMFVSSHDFRLFLVVLLMSSGIALLVGAQLSRPLARDVQRLGAVAERVGSGDLTVRTGIERRDEVGKAAAALDQMIVALADAAAERTRLLDARQMLFTSVGHDLRTPLAAMQAAVESLEDGLAPDPQRYFALLANQLAAVNAMLDQMLEYARLESGSQRAVTNGVSLAELADECAETMAPLAARRQVSVAVAADGPAIVRGSDVELARLLRNLVDNAVRHSPPGEAVQVNISNGGGTVELAVIDRGAGFPDDFVGRAFDPFSRADSSRNAQTGNAGLGLAICRSIVDAHGGRIWIDPRPGATVRVSFPAQTPMMGAHR